ncbi:tRNA (adenosine(37)-N6)-threonylcarbamoyltransferase complex ATPase subunit type 1 TsaE [Lyngbya confervoides]|uniref:tRNA threonylcarbamoyladenosine biosynthesis protein TsaE n=1 Tax=Lyngbya confervoides BDU141951 TaxID=1574623 RepID=A0ABD4T8S5_9CYAN|nr:tRNA (adenosine(37)-N6)-threonylcarbamoyltransferase complex ATPase subunit type 1 TsaE [Lyngbya confervoides]MCM1985158.1 tRNA (adenosine(37)-N6)-threonylcarbamoyltransferase complex ATPase subunit type 1 TsaE [Lyngbya confervoides BDU141951]
MKLHLPDPEATRAIGLKLGRSLPAGTTLLLEGELGTGKTSLVQSLGEGLGITDAIVSPTFTLINEYLEGRVPLYHLDLYRLKSDQVSDLYLENYLEGLEVPLGIVAIEWADRLPQRPDAYLKIQLSYEGAGRSLQILSCGPLEFNLDALT